MCCNFHSGKQLMEEKKMAHELVILAITLGIIKILLTCESCLTLSSSHENKEITSLILQKEHDIQSVITQASGVMHSLHA